MPTGYTYDVQAGKITTLEDFAKSCGRAFIWQARDSSEQDLRKLVSEGRDLSHYTSSLAEAKKNLQEYLDMTDADWEALVKRENKLSLKYYEDRVKEMKVQEVRYRDMLKRVKEWNPPTDKHIEFKRFMVSQLEDSIKFDIYEVSAPKIVVDSKEYRAERIDNIKQNIERIEKKIEKSKNNASLGVEWVEQLLASVEGK
jgi:hypothetical protein